MIVYDWKDLKVFSKTDLFSKGTAISVGSFDGLHLGHRFLLNNLVQKAREHSLVPGLITFKRPLPAIKHSSDYAGDISSLRQRLKLFEQLGIEFVFVVDFDDDFSKLRGIDFLSMLSQNLNMQLLAEGIDFRCGYKGATDTQAIKYWASQNNVECIFVDPVYYTEADGQQERVSSSYIRVMLLKGFFITAAELLQHPYELDAAQMRKNLEAGEPFIQLLPPDGIYHPLSENNEQIRLEISEGKVLSVPDCDTLIFS